MAVQLKIRTKNADLIRKGLEDLTREVPKISRLRIYEMMRRALVTMRTPGDPIRYPVNWESEKQRIFVIAMLRARNDLPYTRTNALPEAWTIERSDPNGYILINKNDAAVYLYGDYEGARQSSIHKGRHPIFQVELEKEIIELPKDIEEHITYYGRSKQLA